ncbi:hypothetical protein VFPPC_16965 [Pochonia chlamydosporia 170]|uniref:Uncharacterized protein n=1 Tax=Pochonia chlamydosporia 170 TaxID=1380566 RepID=A0A179EZ62_METCM|nr:hypothetical protein VFPPC_16965 [Pochonia chlamydosporia 170]OAQ58484.2 hypothetical protein VFPPC_16965 [Pochonia chlamydosporia 170]
MGRPRQSHRAKYCHRIVHAIIACLGQNTLRVDLLLRACLPHVLRVEQHYLALWLVKPNARGQVHIGLTCHY